MFFFSGQLSAIAQCPAAGFPAPRQLKHEGGHLHSTELCAPPHTMEQWELVIWSRLPHRPHFVKAGGRGQRSTLWVSEKQREHCM